MKFPFTDLHSDSIDQNNSDLNNSDHIVKITDWETIRRLYPLIKEIVYLNSGTEGSMSKRTLKEYNDSLQNWASNPSYHFAFDKITEDWQKFNRNEVAKFLSTKGENICITNNTTEGISMVLMGLDFSDGDEIIISSHAYPSLVSILNVLSKKSKIIYKVVIIPTSMNSKEEIIDAFSEAYTNKTKMICISHVTYTTGLQMPIKELCEFANKKNIISFIDGAHAVGMIPIDVEDLGCDFYSAAGHKWLNGPPGTGILYIRNAKENVHNLKPIISELYGFETSYSITDMLQIRGCNNAPGFTALVNAIRLNEKIGKDLIYERIIQLNNYLNEVIITNWGEESWLSHHGSKQKDLCSGIATFVPSKETNKKYDEKYIKGLSSELINNHKIWIRYINFTDNPSITKNKTWGLRVSTNLFNNFTDIEILINTLKKII